jgi:hypothetical protein
MTATPIKELYNSPNGDQWILSKDEHGKLVVVHHPNKSSGGRSSEISVEVFLAHGGQGPEHQSLLEALASLPLPDESFTHQKLSPDETERLGCALGQAVVRCWSDLPQEIQHNLFEAAVTSEGEVIRQQLAVYLHEKHGRTADGIQARSMPTPDSLGG